MKQRIVLLIYSKLVECQSVSSVVIILLLCGFSSTVANLLLHQAVIKNRNPLNQSFKTVCLV
jgi:hypothetical protein